MCDVGRNVRPEVGSESNRRRLQSGVRGKNMKTQYLSKQEIYDGAVRHLFGQGGAAILRQLPKGDDG